MKSILSVFMILAACGLVLSAITHVLTFVGLHVPAVAWVLHLGIFIVWIPALLVSLPLLRNARRQDFWKLALANCPLWMRRGLYVLFGYVFLNFILFFVTTVGQPKPPKDAPTPPAVVRGFSGHWMAFYAAAFAMLYSCSRARAQATAEPLRS